MTKLIKHKTTIPTPSFMNFETVGGVYDKADRAQHHVQASASFCQRWSCTVGKELASMRSSVINHPFSCTAPSGRKQAETCFPFQSPWSQQKPQSPSQSVLLTPRHALKTALQFAFAAVTPLRQPVEELQSLKSGCSHAGRQRSHRRMADIEVPSSDDLKGSRRKVPLSHTHRATTEHWSRNGSREEKEQMCHCTSSRKTHTSRTNMIPPMQTTDIFQVVCVCVQGCFECVQGVFASLFVCVCVSVQGFVCVCAKGVCVCRCPRCICVCLCKVFFCACVCVQSGVCVCVSVFKVCWCVCVCARGVCAFVIDTFFFGLSLLSDPQAVCLLQNVLVNETLRSKLGLEV